MLRLEGNRGVQFCDGLTRRDFLRVGGLAVGLSLTELARLRQLGAAPRQGKSCIQLFLVGGPGQLDTWDLKPHAPDDVRGPFRPVRTNVPGIDVCEHFPLMAQRADRYAIVRSVCHQEAPIHETGHQLMQTGRLFRRGVEWPHYGAVLSKVRPAAGPLPPWVVLPGPIGNTGVSVSHGQTAGFLGAAHEAFVPAFDQDLRLADRRTPHGLDPARPARPHALLDAVDGLARELDRRSPEVEPAAAVVRDVLLSPSARRAFDLDEEPVAVRERYGLNTFGQSCLLARRLVQFGVGLVTVNMFDTVFGQVTWDCHANGGDLGTTLDDYKTTLCPMLDAAYTALLDDLVSLGLLDDSLVLAMGEFGRTPKLNNRGGRDHWPGVWSILMAGGGVRGGQVIGASNRLGEEPKDCPVHPAEIAATVYHALGIDPSTRLPGTDGRLMPLVEARPVMELF
jgi:Protein of unknown function (DUF1501)